MELRAGDRLIVGRPGTFIAVPTGVAHAFANHGNLPTRMLLVTTPPGHERYFAELITTLSRESAPDPDEIAALRARVDQHRCHRYRGARHVGPARSHAVARSANKRRRC